jgi:hypothetical protein
MSYIGNTPTTQSFISGTDYFNGTGAQTAFTLSRTVASVNDIQAVVNNVVQVPNDAYTISGTTITFTSAPSAGTQNVYVRYLSTTTQAITPSQNTVSWSTLDSNVQGDLGISFKNRIINSNMAIDQRNVGASGTSQSYPVDRWLYQPSQSNKITWQQNAGSVTPPAGFKNYLGITSSSAYSVTSGDYFFLSQTIEGYNIADLGWGASGASTVTLSFWVRSSLTGTFGGSIRAGGFDQSYPFSYTISSANTWEQKSVTITGATAGTFGSTNGNGLQVCFSLGAGSTYSGTAGAWSGSNLVSATGATSVVGTNGATWYITGVQLEVGTQATTFTTAGGSYGAELALCQRYFWKAVNPHLAGVASSTTALNRMGTSLPVTMRAPPTVSYSGTIQWYDGGVSGTITSASSIYSNTNSFEMDATPATGTTTQGRAVICYLDNSITGFFSIDAEL